MFYLCTETGIYCLAQNLKCRESDCNVYALFHNTDVRLITEVNALVLPSLCLIAGNALMARPVIKTWYSVCDIYVLH